MLLGALFVSPGGLSPLASAESPMEIRCPAFLSGGSVLPMGARLIGNRPARRAYLWDAVPSLGQPEDIDSASRALNDTEADEIQTHKDGTSNSIWRLTPRPLDIADQWERHMLACRYGPSRRVASGTGPGAVLLLIPLPARIRFACTVATAAPASKTIPRVKAYCAAMGQ
jgi:hypothetical protein